MGEDNIVGYEGNWYQYSEYSSSVCTSEHSSFKQRHVVMLLCAVLFSSAEILAGFYPANCGARESLGFLGSLVLIKYRTFRCLDRLELLIFYVWCLE